jgi:2,4-dienoyl-CoA reductase-like NADH-dependent reductase (Old Yellow Enzyme family)/NADPH-dependent 2,4-dienoyl-CoA reductase/sulfur reductase-like enzyme
MQAHAMSQRYPHLLSAGRIGGLKLRNRIVMAAMGTNFAGADGHCTERLIAYYEARARGGVGLLVLETSAAFWPSGASMPNTIAFSDDRYIPGLRELTERVHLHGAKIVAQLNHSGTKAQEDTAAGRPIPVPSPVGRARSDMLSVLTEGEIANFIKGASPDGTGPKYYEMTPDDIAATVRGFAAAAARARESGFDGIELHAGHGYLLANFLSPYTNQRTDQYGGSVVNRARFLVETIAAVRSATTPDFPILVRLDAYEFRMEGGIEVDDCVQTSRLCELAGADAIDVSAYGNVARSIAFTEAPLVHEPGGFIDFAKAVKGAVAIPVIAVGRIEPDVAERSLAAGDFDYLAMGRKLLADPDLPNKLLNRQEESVKPCIYCYICVSQIFINQPVCCAVNHATGREYEGDILARTGAAKNILVIGGGPAGMESARLLAEKGHRVTLWEKDADLGGTARIAGLAYSPNEKLVHYLTNAVRALPVSIQLRTMATRDNIDALDPDHIILATGAARVAPDIPGKTQRHVFDGDELRGILFGNNPIAIAKLSVPQQLILRAGRLSQLLRNIGLMRVLSKLWMPITRDVVVIGGGLVGLELAEYLVERKRNVTVLEPGPGFGPELALVRRARVLHLLRENGAILHKSVENIDIGERAVRFTLNGEAREQACGQVIIAMGAQPDHSLLQQLTDSRAQVHQIGDCRRVGYIDGAILDARLLVQRLEKAL